MPVPVEIPGLGVVEFPDSMTPEEINREAEKLYADANPERDVKAEGRSVSGFLSNVVRSGGEQIGSLASAVTSPVETAKGVGRLALGTAQKLIPGRQSHEDAADAVGRFYKDRYGSLEGVGRTLYEDPVGALADASTLLGGSGAALRVASAAGKAGKLAKVAKVLTKAGDAANPAALVTKPAAAALKAGGELATVATVRPSAALAREFAGRRAIARTIIEEATPTTSVAGRKLGTSVRKVDAAIADAEQAGAPAIPAMRVVKGLRPVATEVRKRVQAGKASEMPEVVERAKNLVRRNPGGIKLTDAQTLKKALQDDAEAAYRAQDRGASVSDVTRRLDQAEASALRSEIERAVPSVAAENQRAQRLIGARRALADSEDRPGVLGKQLALMQAGGALASGNSSLLATGLGTAMLDYPAVGTSVGIGLDRAGRVLDSTALHRAALLALLAEQAPEE